MPPIRRSLDRSMAASAASRPGIDPRINLTLAVVKDVAFDPDHGIFVDLQFQPTGEEETALLGSPYADDDAGAFFPLKEGDTVLVALPGGDPNNGPIIIARVWTPADKPFAEAASSGDGVRDAGDNVVIKTATGSKIILTAVDADTEISTTGTTSKLKLQDGSQSFVRGDDQKGTLSDFFDALSTWATIVRAGIIAGGGTLDNTDLDLAISRAKQGLTDALSSRIKGQ